MNLSAKYRKSYDHRWCMRFKSRHPEDDTHDGVVTSIKRHFIVINAVQDFEFDGLMVFPKHAIKGYRDGRFEKCLNQILRQNGQLHQLRTIWISSCETIGEVVTTLQEREIWPAVETLDHKGKSSAFYIGPITKVKDDGIFIHCYDADGTWEKVHEIEYTEILRMEFNSRYCNHFNRYMQSKTP